MDVVTRKYILLKLADSLSGSEQPDFDHIGYLARRSKDTRTPAKQRREMQRELAKLREEFASRKEIRRRHREYLKGLSKTKLGKDREQGERESGCGDLETASAVRDIQSDADSPPLSKGRTPSDTPAVPKDMSIDHWPYFDEVFMVSALNGDGVSKLKVQNIHRGALQLEHMLHSSQSGTRFLSRLRSKFLNP